MNDNVIYFAKIECYISIYYGFQCKLYKIRVAVDVF